MWGSPNQQEGTLLPIKLASYLFYNLNMPNSSSTCIGCLSAKAFVTYWLQGSCAAEQTKLKFFDAHFERLIFFSLLF